MPKLSEPSFNKNGRILHDGRTGSTYSPITKKVLVVSKAGIEQARTVNAYCRWLEDRQIPFVLKITDNRQLLVKGLTL